MFKTIVRNQVMMRNILTDVLQEIKNINVKSNIETDEESVLKNIVLPIDSEEGLNELEELLKADNNFKKCVGMKYFQYNINEFSLNCLLGT